MREECEGQAPGEGHLTLQSQTPQENPSAVIKKKGSHLKGTKDSLSPQSLSALQRVFLARAAGAKSQARSFSFFPSSSFCSAVVCSVDSTLNAPHQLTVVFEIRVDALSYLPSLTLS